ncbi:MAG: phytanoyl-CoA dioxygenase family protein [Candidatus Poribacteria bacterium]|nr:phytanoyl-CoA dioxygenase family protein [Candidatus Poribacteria bacterium]
MEITATQVNHFRTHGFFFIPNPFGEARMREMERLAAENEEQWATTDWPNGFNRLACQFFMIGEPILRMVEQPQLIEAAKRLLECDRVHVGACGLGDASKIICPDSRQRQVHWHADGGPEVQQVSFRTALDRHDPTNAPLRILPGSHRRSREEVWEELIQLEIATGQHDVLPEKAYVKHPAEVEVVLDPRWMLVWTPSCWHATGVKTAAGPRRAMGWNYFPAGGRKRDLRAMRYIFAEEWESWGAERKRLWGLLD